MRASCGLEESPGGFAKAKTCVTSEVQWHRKALRCVHDIVCCSSLITKVSRLWSHMEGATANHSKSSKVNITSRRYQPSLSANFSITTVTNISNKSNITIQWLAQYIPILTNEIQWDGAEIMWKSKVNKEMALNIFKLSPRFWLQIICKTNFWLSLVKSG